MKKTKIDKRLVSIPRTIAFEGPDKSGKETQSRLLQSALSVHYDTFRVATPTTLCPKTYKAIYWMLQNGWARTFPYVFQILHFFNKLIFQLIVLPRLRRVYDIIIFDRWKLSSIIYGSATGVNVTFNSWINKRLLDPEITFVMCSRSFERKTTSDDDYEKDANLQQKVREEYHNWAKSHPLDHVLVDNNRSIDDVHLSIVEHLVKHS